MNELTVFGALSARQTAARTLLLWRSLAAAPLPENRSLHDTLRSIGKGFRRYDTRFFPQRFPCDIDYQLALPVPESLLGIDYVNRYLTHLTAESILLSALPRQEVRAALERSCPDWRGLLINLYAPSAPPRCGTAAVCAGYSCKEKRSGRFSAVAPAFG